MNTHLRQVRNHLETHKSITAKQAIDKYQCYRLAARIYDLRKAGMKIYTIRKRGENSNSYAEYVI